MKRRTIYVGTIPVDLSDVVEVAQKISPTPEYMRLVDIEYDDPLLTNVYAAMRALISDGTIASCARGTLVDANQYIVVLTRITEATEDMIDLARMAQKG